MKAISNFFAKMTSRQKVLLSLIGGILAIVGLVYFVAGSASAESASITGTLQFSGLRPDPEDEGTITLLYRPYNDGAEFISTGVTIPLLDGSSWEWKDSAIGKTYELQPQLVIRGQVVGTADPVIVTAPAQNIQLHLKVTWKDLPNEIVAQQTTTLGGTAAIQGVIPSGATLEIQARLANATSYQTIQELDSAGRTNNWMWTEARPLASYKVKAVLRQGTTQIGESPEVAAEAGESEVALTVVSGANSVPTPTPPSTPPSPGPSATPTPPSTVKGTIFGKVFINGPKQANSSILMLFRTPGIGEYREIGRIKDPSHGGQEWRFNAVAGVTYEIMAVLQVNESNTASSRSQIVTAPAQGINFTINTGVTIDTPQAQPSLESCNRASDNRWDATIRFPEVTQAGNYWFQIGSNPGSSDLFNEKRGINSNQREQRITVRVDGRRNYFAQYAFSLCRNCSNDSNFSHFSQPFQFSCDQQPTPTPTPEPGFTGYICNQSNNACELTRGANPPFAFNNAGLEQCQRACAPTPPPTPTPTPAATVAPGIVPLPEML